MLVLLANNGIFIKGKIETQQIGQHEDSTGKVNEDFECDIYKEADLDEGQIINK